MKPTTVARPDTGVIATSKLRQCGQIGCGGWWYRPHVWH
ncbi:hypothetical protein I550_1608 [Mycobacterium intracellulare 1956]|uniref:Uncharacterized protein n=1 Tax=Mycobacterium intracellulare 1956 TaxID=1299331 RepID=X8CT97_MYCIT|nr:hypothetical protein I550_1608 [Mycobacterium intracellulare 1956]